jgi:acetyltransferase-like isoleucine patch superfamily enzyme
MLKKMKNNLQVENLKIGNNVNIHPTAVIKGLNGKADNIEIGDNVYIGAHVQIICDNFSIGDYSKIQHNTNIHGYKPCEIGHNAWIGQFSIIDCIGGVKIGDNCGIGAHSQLWSHIKYGDTLEGCRFLSDKEMRVGKDVWFVGHCIVSPIIAEDKSMAMVGSVVTKNMEYNNIYAGSPASSISNKVGFQFVETSVESKLDRMNKYLKEFETTYKKFHNIKIVASKHDINSNDEFSYFAVETRIYKKTLSESEVEFMRYLLPDKAKFTPINDPL